jgi:SAM-dependent methyltransferase
MTMSDVEIPDDWYRFAYPPSMAKTPWAQRTVEEVDRVVAILDPPPGARILDLACGTGRHALELSSRGYDVVGVELLEANVEVAREAATTGSLETEFIAADVRSLELEEEFDVVLSLNDGAIGYFPTEDENRKVFEAVSAALGPGGRHLAQLPNVMHAEAFMPTKGWIEGTSALELIDHRWNVHTKSLEGSTASIVVGEPFDGLEFVPFRKRLYSLAELEAIYASVGMEIEDVFRGNGKTGRPRRTQYEVFVVAVKK